MPMYDIYAGANDVEYQGTFRFDNFSQAEKYAFMVANLRCVEKSDEPQWYIEEELDVRMDR